MKILFDAINIINEPTGAGVYTLNILKNIAKLLPKKYFSVMVRRNLKPTHEVFSLPITFIKSDIPTIGIKREIQLPGILKKLSNEFDLFYSFMPYLSLKALPIKSIITIHDLAFLKYPEVSKTWIHRIYFHLLMKRSVAQAEHIFTVSKSTKNDIIKQFGSSANTISIASPSSSFEQFRDIQSKNNHKRKGYFLFVGERRKHKNIINIIKAFSLFTIKSKSHIDFFMVGRDYDRRYTELIKTTIGKLRLGKRIFLLKDIDSQKLVSLYKKSLALIFVSYYEGFGIPILEAMSFGIPVITSNVYSMPEVGGKAVLQVSPENIQDIANKMQSLITDDELRKKMIKSGKTQSRKFSWLKSARIISEFLNNHAY